MPTKQTTSGFWFRLVKKAIFETIPLNKLPDEVSVLAETFFDVFEVFWTQKALKRHQKTALFLKMERF